MYLEWDQAVFLMQTCNTFLQLFVVSLVQHIRISCLVKVLSAFNDTAAPVAPFPISSSVAFADHHSCFKTFFLSLTSHLNENLLKLPHAHNTFPNSSSLNHCLFLFKFISHAVSAQNKISITLYVSIRTEFINSY